VVLTVSPNPDTDLQHMRLALKLAAQGLYTTRPNPRVGCVIARDEEVIATGWHAQAGQPHAEAHALKAAGGRARGATAYVTLEPCAHLGRTPPCANALIQAGVARVVVACGDPFAAVAGRGLAALTAAGIQVDCGLLHAPARALNVGFFSRIERERPWLRVKMAISLDGRTALANGASRWLTGPLARLDVHRLRARACAILTGVGSVIADDPSLDVRLDAADVPDAVIPPPLKVILDRQLRTRPSHKVLHSAGKTLIAHAPNAEPAAISALQAAGAQLWCLPSATPAQVPALLTELARREINEVHVEAGATLTAALLQADVVDELIVYVAPMLLGPQARPLAYLPEISSLSERFELVLSDVATFGQDVRLSYGRGN
jgi:diaminohydroxyphosphoribosylaminopyrimidine deaminase / 5-amino-6-(5-phosphoribosylamino)uracil reductase